MSRFNPIRLNQTRRVRSVPWSNSRSSRSEESAILPTNKRTLPKFVCVCNDLWKCYSQVDGNEMATSTRSDPWSCFSFPWRINNLWITRGISLGKWFVPSLSRTGWAGLTLDWRWFGEESCILISGVLAPFRAGNQGILTFTNTYIVRVTLTTKCWGCARNIYKTMWHEMEVTACIYQSPGQTNKKTD